MNKSKTRFEVSLVNDLTGDPGIYIYFPETGKVILFDCGENYRLSVSDLQRVEQIFISHTHIDHFIGFDLVLRANIGRVKRIQIFGPPEIAQHVQHKLLGYHWNLLGKEGLDFDIREIREHSCYGCQLLCADRYQIPRFTAETPLANATIFSDEEIRIDYATLDHKIPSLAFSLREIPFWNVEKERLASFPHPPGPWLSVLKQAVQEGKAPETSIDVEGMRYSLGELTQKLLVQSPGCKLVYVTDTIYSPETEAKIVALAQGADWFYCEHYCPEEDVERAREFHHLTARQAGVLARQAQVGELCAFHISPKYQSRVREVREEGQQALATSE